LRAGGDMGFGRGNLTRRQNLQGVGARYLALFAAVQVWAQAHTCQTSTARSWIGARGVKDAFRYSTENAEKTMCAGGGQNENHQRPASQREAVFVRVGEAQGLQRRISSVLVTS